MSYKDGIPYKERGSGQELEEALLCSQTWLLSRLLWKWRGKYIPEQRIQEEIFGLSFEKSVLILILEGHGLWIILALYSVRV